MLFCCFCKRKTAYEVRISDWSSDGCSADLDDARIGGRRRDARGCEPGDGRWGAAAIRRSRDCGARKMAFVAPASWPRRDCERDEPSGGRTVRPARRSGVVDAARRPRRDDRRRRDDAAVGYAERIRAARERIGSASGRAEVGADDKTQRGAVIYKKK